MNILLGLWTLLVYSVGPKNNRRCEIVLFQFVALQLSCEVEELEMHIRMDHHRVSVGSRPSSTGEAKSRPFDDLERLNEEKLVLELHPSFVSSNGDMVRSSLNRFNAIILACLVMFR